MFTVYKVEQVTWGDGRYSDFDLPNLIGVYTTRELAELGIKKHQAIILARKSPDSADHTTRTDYDVQELDVRESPDEVE